LCGVIDWGDIHAGDPALDLAISDLVFDDEDHAAFDAAYGPIDKRTRARARWRAIYHAALTADYAHRTGNAALLAVSLDALRRLAGSRGDRG
jgi:aminoglycoside phosphotransferase (APT) family kinase protein